MNSASTFGGYSDADFKRTIVQALRLLVVLAVVGAGLCGWKLGWQSGALLLVGAAISGSGLWEWMRLMSVVMERMDEGSAPRPMGFLLAGFVLRLLVTLAVLYGSVKYLHGSVYALAGGLGLGVIALLVEGFRLLKAWTV